MADSIISVSGSGSNVYQIDINDYTCTCPNWERQRSQYEQNDPRRLCKHLIKVIAGNGLEGEFPDTDITSLASSAKGYPLGEEVEFVAPQYVRSLLGESVTQEQAKNFKYRFKNVNSPHANANHYGRIVEKGAKTIYATHEYDLELCELLVHWKVIQQGAEVSPASMLQFLKVSELKSYLDSIECPKIPTKKPALIQTVLDHGNWQDALAIYDRDINSFYHFPLLQPEDFN